MSNSTYDRLKWVALAFCPALEVLVLTIGKIWSLPYYAEIGATIAAIGLFIAACLGVASKNYYELAEDCDIEVPELVELDMDGDEVDIEELEDADE